MKNNFLLIILVLILNACTVANLPSKEIPLTFEKNQQKGMILGAIALDKSGRTITNGYYFYYTNFENNNVDRPKENYIKIIPSQTFYVHFKPDFFDEKKAIYYFKIEKPAGKYKFYAKRIIQNTVQYVSYETIELNIPFEIINGKVNYIGELYFKPDKTYEIIDKSERDLNKLKEMFPLLEISK